MRKTKGFKLLFIIIVMSWLKNRLVKSAHAIDEYVVMQAQQKAGMFSHDVSNVLQKYMNACHYSNEIENLEVALKWGDLAKQIEEKILSFIYFVDNRQYPDAKRALKSVVGKSWFHSKELWV